MRALKKQGLTTVHAGNKFEVVVPLPPRFEALDIHFVAVDAVRRHRVGTLDFRLRRFVRVEIKRRFDVDETRLLFVVARIKAGHEKIGYPPVEVEGLVLPWQAESVENTGPLGLKSRSEPDSLVDGRY